MGHWVNLINASNDRSLVVQVYKEMFRLTVTQPGVVTWASRVFFCVSTSLFSNKDITDIST